MSGRKLGRGLDVLIGASAEAKPSEVLDLPPGSIEANPEQPRREFVSSELEMLKASIRRQGVLQPVLVRKVDDRYQLVAGERRLRACRELGLETIPALLIPTEDDRMLELALVENIQRENLNPLEVAQAFRQMMASRGVTQEELGKAIGFSRSQVGNILRLLDLPESIQKAVGAGKITLGHAKILLSISEPEVQQQLFDKIAEENLSVRELEDERDASEVTSGENGRRPRARRRPAKAPQIVSLEEQFSEKLGTRVTIHEGKGKGRVVIEFYSQDDFERVRDVLMGSSSGVG